MQQWTHRFSQLKWLLGFTHLSQIQQVKSFLSPEHLHLLETYVWLKLELLIEDNSLVQMSGRCCKKTSAAAFMRPCLETVNKQHGEKAPAVPQGPSSTVTHSWVLRRTLPVCQLACLCHDTGGVGGGEEGHMCVLLQALGCLHAPHVFPCLFLWTPSSISVTPDRL